MADLSQQTIGEAITAEEEALTSHAQDNLQVIAGLAEKDAADVGPLRARIEKISSVFGTPGYFLFATTFIVTWIAVNGWGVAHHWVHVDEPPFFWLQGIVSSNALLLTISVLIRQDRMAALSSQRSHLDLQINMLTEGKVAKVLELLATMERDRSAEHVDHAKHIAELAKPADAEALMQAIKRTDGPPKQD